MVYLEKFLFSFCLVSIFLRPFISQLAFGRSDFLLTTLFSLAAIPIIAINKNKIKSNHVDIFILLFIVSSAISLFFAQDLIFSLSKVLTILGYIVVFYLIRSLDKKRQEKILKTIIFSAVVICCYGIYQYFWGFRHVVESLTRNHIFYPSAYEWLDRRRVFAVFFNPNAFAGFLIMVIPLTYALKRIQKDVNTSSKFLLLLILLLAINLVMTQSISAIFSLVFSICLIILYKRRGRVSLYFGAFIGLIAIVIIFYSRNKTDSAFITPLFSFGKRIDYYKEAFQIIRQHPFFGIGLGNFKGKDSLFVHNSYLQIWIELGILGIASYAGILFISAKSMVKKLAADSQANKYLLPLFCAFLAFTIHNLLDYTFFLPEVSWLWWIIVALIIS